MKRIKSWVWLLAVWGIFLLACQGIDDLDHAGWRGHQTMVEIAIPTDWLIGESKICESTPLDAAGAAGFATGIGDVFSMVDCSTGNGSSATHRVKILFYGRQYQPEYEIVHWECFRNSGYPIFQDSMFTCKETDGVK